MRISFLARRAVAVLGSTALLILALGAALFSAPAAAQNPDPVYDVLVDLDRNTSTGCTVTPTGNSPVGGFERRLRATLDPDTLTVSSVDLQDCDGTIFQTQLPLTSGYPAALNTGVGGADAIEIAVTRNALGAGGQALLRIGFAADDFTGSDVLVTTDGSADGPFILLGLPFSVPTLSILGLLLLAALVVVVAWRTHRRTAQLSTVGFVLLVATVAWAALFNADGDLSDWAGVSPSATDPSGDATNGGSLVDLVAGFGAVEDDVLYFRMDLVDIENQPPIAADDAYTTDEDTALNIAAPGVLTNDSDPDGDPVTAALQSGPASAQAFTLNADGSFDYTPIADFNGSDSFTYVANDGQADSAVATVTLTINPINDPPIAADDSATTLEDQSVTIDVLVNDSDIDGNLDPAGVSITTAAASGTAVPDPGTGQITYTPDADTNGTDSFVYQVCDDGTPLPAECATATVTIVVEPVNDAPSFTAGGDQVVLEDAGAQTVAGWATAISAGPPDEAGQVLTFNITANDNPALFSAGPTIDPTTGDLGFTPAADANGTASITVTLSDDGGTANGGVDTSAPASFTITVEPVNDAPSFTPGLDVDVLEDSGAYSQPWASNISPGPADEAGQTVAFSITGNTNAALFAAVPVIAPDGTLSFTLAADANGAATITVFAQDDGGTANGGVDASAPVSFLIDVTGVNDAPSFTSGGDVASDEDAGAQTVAGWATAIDPGAPDEAGQALTFNIIGNDNAALFAAGPALDAATGNLSYTAAPDANGVATITVTLSDDGGTANGGVDTSAPASFTITVNPVNDPPVATAPGPFDVLTNVRIQVTDGADDLLANASDPADGPGALPLFIGGTVPTITTAGGDLTINTADGTFSYNPPAGYTGADSFDYQVCDNGVPGSLCTSPITVTLSVAGPAIWFVDGTAAAGGDGRLTAPFDSLDALDAVNGAGGTSPGVGDSIFLAESIITGQLTLQDTQRVFGAGASQPLATMAGAAVPTYSDPLPATGSVTPPVLNQPGVAILTLAQDNLLRGFNIGDSVIDIFGINFGTLTVSEVRLIAGGEAMNLQDGTLADGLGNPGFTEVTSTSGAQNIRLANIDGTPTFGTGALTGANGNAIEINGGNAVISYDGTVSNNLLPAAIVSVQNKTGGSVTLGGAISGSNGGIQLAFNAPAVPVTFAGTLSLDLAAPGQRALRSIDGGMLSITGAGNVLGANGVPAIDIETTTIAGAGVTVERVVNANGSDHGIRVVGTSGGPISVTGAGGACPITGGCSGGEIAGTNSHGILLDGVGNDVTLQNIRVVSAGAANDQNGIEIIDATGSMIFDSMAVADAADDAVEVSFTSAQTLPTLSITNSTFEGIGDFPGGIYNPAAGNGFGGAAIDLAIANGATVGTLTLDNLTIRNFDGRGISAVVGSNTTAGTLSGGSVTNIDMSGIGTFGFAFLGDGTGVGTLNLADSTIADVDNSSGMVVESNGNASITLAAARNTISVVNESFFGVSCNRIVNDGNLVSDVPQLSVTLDNHICVDVADAEPLYAISRGSQGRFDFQTTNNTLTAAPGTFVPGSYIEAGNGTPGEADTVCLDQSANDSDGDGGNGEPGIRLVQNAGTTFGLDGFAGTGTNALSVEAFIDAQNPLSLPGSDVDDLTGVVNFITPMAPCNTPAAP